MLSIIKIGDPAPLKSRYETTINGKRTVTANPIGLPNTAIQKYRSSSWNNSPARRLVPRPRIAERARLGSSSS